MRNVVFQVGLRSLEGPDLYRYVAPGWTRVNGLPSTASACDSSALGLHCGSALGLHERTLRRRLQLEGTSFRELLDEARQAASCQYLAGTSLSIKAIALALGYRSTDAFVLLKRRHFEVGRRF